MGLQPLESKNLGEKRDSVAAPVSYPAPSPLKTIAPPSGIRQENPISPGANVEALAHYGVALERLHAGRKNGAHVADYAGIRPFDEWAVNFLSQMSPQKNVLAASPQRGATKLITLKV